MKPFDGRPIRQTLSRFKGVTRNGRRWVAQFYFAKHKPHIIGAFETEEDAARAYDEFALIHRGPSTFLNFRDLGLKTDPIVEGETALVPLAGGGHFRIDTTDLPSVSQYYWNAGHHGSPGGNRGVHSTCLSVLLCGPIAQQDMLIHRNGDPLDFRRENLVLVPRSIAYGGRPKLPGTHSIYKGVKAKRSRWQARIAHRTIGTFDTQEEAAQAYDDAARKRFGPFAALNFPLPGERSCHQPAA